MAKTSSWKAVERAVAAHLGGTRIPVTGRHTMDTPDIEHPKYAIEVKHRADVSQELLSLLTLQTTAAPIVALYGVGASTTLWRAVSLRDLTRRSKVPRTKWPVALVGPQWLMKGFAQAVAAAKAHNKIPLLVVHPKNKNVLESICFLPM